MSNETGAAASNHRRPPGPRQKLRDSLEGDVAGLSLLTAQLAEQLQRVRHESAVLSRQLMAAMERITALEQQIPSLQEHLSPPPPQAGYETLAADPDFAPLLAAIECADEDPLLAMVSAPVERWAELSPIDGRGRRCLQGWLQLWTLEEPRTSRIGWWYEDAEVQEVMTAAAMPFDAMCERYGLPAVVAACQCAGWARLEAIWGARRAA